ncbi:LysR family transcriptional regulator [Tessaracoccus sp. Z1128]
MEVTITQLRAFAAVAEAGHFGRAAVELGLSQPTVSKEVQRLERAVGVPLFLRSPAGTKLTDEGRRLHRQGVGVLNALSEFRAAADGLRREVRGKVRVAGSPSIVNRLLPQLLKTVHEQVEMAIEVMEVETGSVLSAVERGDADLGIGHLLGRSARVQTRRIGRDELKVLAHRSLLNRATAAQMAGLDGLPLLIWPREQHSAYFDLVVESCRSRGLEPLILTGTSRISGSWSYYLQEARAFAVVPADFAEREARHDLVSVAMVPPASVPLEVAWGGHGSAGRVLQILMDLTAPLRVSGVRR